MNYNLNDNYTLYMKYLPKKLKWWQKIFQKLHIKNYYKYVRCGSETYIGDSNE